MKTEKIYRAKAIKIGLISDNEYYLDIIEGNGNQQTITTGSLCWVKKYVYKVIFI